MKRKVLGVLLTSLIAAQAAHAAEIYNKDGNKLDLDGFVEGMRYISNDDSQNGDQSYMRLGIKGETQINDQLTGYGRWQMQANANTSEDQHDQMFTRFAFAGLKFSDYGSLDYGRSDGVMYDTLSYTDMQPEFDGMTYNSDQFMFHRGNSLLTYRNNDFFGLVDGLNFALQYQGKNGGAGEPGERSVLRQNGDGYGMSLSYDIGAGVSVAGSFFSSDRTNDQNNAAVMGNGDRAEAYAAALKYEANGAYLAVMYTQAYNASRFGSLPSDTKRDSVYGYANKSQIFEAYAGYTFDFGLTPFVAYNQTRASKLGASTQTSGVAYGKQDLIKYVDLGASYAFNKNMNAFVDYQINLIDDSDFSRAAGVSTSDVVAMGVVYQF
ncbi:porin OmpC [Mangrovibacter plantisponsor]|uniref:Outer membrane pore protein C n=1 Tax=Mangrovibacter plantisponsor TaxID=451513 RepID=A0A317Q7R4_9ENTR|nr:porin OmpC [Mangrovibacter plantisponsor]PWW11750.1 outer membrane pore protein C [Mangrovibacter plantisponsor]